MKQIVILGHRINVVQSDPGSWHDNGMGRSSQVKGEILVRAGMPEDISLSTLLHEVIHMIADMNNIELDETTVAVLSNGLFDFMQNNKDTAISMIGMGAMNDD